jgi:hypothetical protein
VIPMAEKKPYAKPTLVCAGQLAKVTAFSF